MDCVISDYCDHDRYHCQISRVASFSGPLAMLMDKVILGSEIVHYNRSLSKNSYFICVVAL